MASTRILCVDDDPRILEMLPKVLAVHGYETKTASTVAEAINIITSEKFDVLISDLNMGHVADGFTVIHTMRRINPDCINFLLTGYPAFESALQALREQVDDYLTKPSDIPRLIENIERKLKERIRNNNIPRPVQRLSSILRDNLGSIKSRILVNMKADPEMAALPLTDEERLDTFPELLIGLGEYIDSGMTPEGVEKIARFAEERGRERLNQGYSLPLMVECERIVTQVVNNVIYENLLAVNLSYLLLDVQTLNDMMLLQIKQSIVAFLAAEHKS